MWISYTVTHNVYIYIYNFCWFFSWAERLIFFSFGKLKRAAPNAAYNINCTSPLLWSFGCVECYIKSHLYAFFRFVSGWKCGCGESKEVKEHFGRFHGFDYTNIMSRCSDCYLWQPIMKHSKFIISDDIIHKNGIDSNYTRFHNISEVLDLKIACFSSFKEKNCIEKLSIANKQFLSITRKATAKRNWHSSYNK